MNVIKKKKKGDILKMKIKDIITNPPYNTIIGWINLITFIACLVCFAVGVIIFGAYLFSYLSSLISVTFVKRLVIITAVLVALSWGIVIIQDNHPKL